MVTRFRGLELQGSIRLPAGSRKVGTRAWNKLKLDGRGAPIVLGDDYSFDTVLRHLYVARTQSWMSKDELLVKAKATAEYFEVGSSAIYVVEGFADCRKVLLQLISLMCEDSAVSVVPPSLPGSK